MNVNEDVKETETREVGVKSVPQKEEEFATKETPTPNKKRGRKPIKERSGYFYEEEEQAFVDYITSTDQAFRNKIFKEKLYPAFTKMIESIIRKYKLFTPSEQFEETFNDTLSFMISKVNNFDVTKGKKAYSYCGNICKNHLLLKRTQDMKHRDRMLPYENVFPNPDKDGRIESVREVLPTNFHSELIKKTVSQIKNMLKPNGKLTENEKKVGYALLELLTNWDEIFTRYGSGKFNKTSAYYFMREYTMLSTKDVRDGLKVYKNLYFFTKEKMLDYPQ